MRIQNRDFGKKAAVLMLSAGMLFAAGCSSMTKQYDSISQEEAMEIMESGEEYTIVDVRTKEEYDDSHITGAVLVPIEDIKEGKLDALPDKDRLLLLYCRTGRRAEDAGEILGNAGYTNVKEFGGILTWKGDVETSAPAKK